MGSISLLLACVIFPAGIALAGPRTVLFVVSDDQGYNDVPWTNPDIVMPTFQKYAEEGIILDQNYVQQMCTPTRSAFMTGYYPIHTGRQHGVITDSAPYGLSLDFDIMPQYFKDIGYRAHGVGKWHLGFCSKDYTPLQRGFDSFYGYYTGGEDYYTHSAVGKLPPLYDFHEAGESLPEVNGTYSTYLFSDKAVSLIEDHAANHADEGLFMYLAFQSVHDPLEVPEEYEEQFADITDEARRVYTAMVVALDDAFANILDALDKAGMLDDTVIAMTSDNGGLTTEGANNYPLRGQKTTMWEGGIHVPGFFYHPEVTGGWRSSKLIHATDWIPTLLESVKDTLDDDNLANLEAIDLDKFDGVNQLPAFMSEDAPAVRTEIIHTIDPCYADYVLPNPYGQVALRSGDMKLYIGYPGRVSGWMPIGGEDTWGPSSDPLYQGDVFTTADGLPVWLFNVIADPSEITNLAESDPDTVAAMVAKVETYQAGARKIHVTNNLPGDEADPWTYDSGFYGPGWCDSAAGELVSECLVKFLWDFV